MEVEGKVYRILAPMKGTSARGEWIKQEVVFDQPGEFNRKVCIAFWGDSAVEAGKFKEGEQINVSINLESREHNGRWYTEARAWRFSRPQPVQQEPQPFPPVPPIDEMPLEPEPATGAGEPLDDLPF